MTKDTQQLFDAPWEVGVCEKGNPEFESVFIASKTGCLIGRDMEEQKITLPLFHFSTRHKELSR